MDFGRKYLEKLGKQKTFELKKYLWQLAKINIEIDRKNNVVFKDKEKLNEKTNMKNLISLLS